MRLQSIPELLRVFRVAPLEDHKDVLRIVHVTKDRPPLEPSIRRRSPSSLKIISNSDHFSILCSTIT